MSLQNWLIKQIEKKMQEAAYNLSFDKATIYKDMMNYMRYLHNNSSSENNTMINKRILLVEKIEEGYKVFCIDKGRIILKKIYPKVTKDGIREFLIYADILSNNTLIRRNEKRDLDFKQIINAEIRDKSNKVMITIDDDYNLDGFVNDIVNIK